MLLLLCLYRLQNLVLINSEVLATMALSVQLPWCQFAIQILRFFLLWYTGDAAISDEYYLRVDNLFAIWFAYKEYFIEQPCAWYGS